MSWATRGPGHSDTGFRVGQGHGTVPWGLQPHVLQGPGEALRVSRHPGRGHGVTATVHSPFCICDDFFMKKKKNKNKPRHVFPKYPLSLCPAPHRGYDPIYHHVACVVLLCWALVVLQTPSDTEPSDSAGAAGSTVRAGSLPGSASPASRPRDPLSSYCYGQTFLSGFKLLAAHGDY